ncbi:MAG: YceD family protein [Lentisphaeria bacterium]
MSTFKDRVIVHVARIDYVNGLSIEQVLPGSLLDLDPNDRFSKESDIEVNLLAKHAGKNILVTGEIRCGILCECNRCLEKYPQKIEIIDFCEYFDEFDDYIDLTDVIRESILLAFPTRTLCDDDCAGICLECGANLNKIECGCVIEEFELEEEEEEKNIWDCLDNLKIEDN